MVTRKMEGFGQELQISIVNLANVVNRSQYFTRCRFTIITTRARWSGGQKGELR